MSSQPWNRPWSRLDEAARRAHAWHNLLQSGILVVGMGGLLAACTLVLFGPSGPIWVLAGVLVALLVRPSVPTDLLLQMYGAQQIPESRFPEGYRILSELAHRADLPARPSLYYVPSPTINAFAVGKPEQAAVAITDGMLRLLGPRELAGVLAHEISHIRNNDLGIMMLADLISRLTSFMSLIGQILLLLNLPLVLAGYTVPIPWLLVLLLLFAPTLTSLLQLALSRTREYNADLDAVSLTRDPRGLASALTKLERYQGRFWEEIIFPGRRIPEPSILRTHPSTEDRVERLLELERQADEAGPFLDFGDRLGPPHDRPHPPRPPRWHWSGLWY